MPPGFPHGSVARVPMIMAKQDRMTLGGELTGATVKIMDNQFMTGLDTDDVGNNVKLLRERPWLDIAAVFSDGKRVVLAMEKGAGGERAFSEAFAAWQH